MSVYGTAFGREQRRIAGDLRRVPVVAVVTNVGYLACAACSERLEITGQPVYVGATHSDEPCDYCGQAKK